MSDEKFSALVFEENKRREIRHWTLRQSLSFEDGDLCLVLCNLIIFIVHKTKYKFI